MRLLLARHGQTVWNAGRRFQGGSDVALSAVGRAQAEALGRAVRGYRVAAAYVSPMRRALETAAIALQGTAIPVVPLPELRELSLGEWEGRTVDEIRARDGDPYLAWLRAPHDCPPPGGEPLPAVCARMLRAVELIGARHPNGDDVLVVAHGGVISVYACHLLGLSFNALWRLRVDNCSLTVARPPRIVTVNDTTHLWSGVREDGADGRWPEKDAGRLRWSGVREDGADGRWPEKDAGRLRTPEPPAGPPAPAPDATTAP